MKIVLSNVFEQNIVKKWLSDPRDLCSSISDM